ncbi:MAG: hydroxyacid dehydrogenase [Candidatus Gracilibacteria bacterium]|jgi:D-3-phosphoglycerate dehydrogenase
MKKVLVATKLPEKALIQLKEFFDVTILENPSSMEFKKAVAPAEILIVRSTPLVDKEIIEAGTNLKIIARAGAGLDNIDIVTAKEKNIQILNTPGANSNAVAELVFAIILNLYRKIREADFLMKNDRWEKNLLVGNELNGKTIGIIGLGKIGRIVAGIANSFGMKVIGFDTFLSPDEFKKINVTQVDSLGNMAKEADIITLHIPKTPETENLINSDIIAKMKPTTTIINCSRGGIVNEKDLYEALKANKILGAGIDTWENEPTANTDLKNLPNVIALPHIGASTVEAQEKCSTELVGQIVSIATMSKRL